MLTKKLLIALAAAGLTCLTATHGLAKPAVAGAATTSSTSSSGVTDDALVSRYTKLAGSPANAQSLVTGLRTGSIVTLADTGGAPAVSFTPATLKMGFGNINIALALAKTSLAKQGITNPTPAQLAAALNGGSITLTNGTVVVMAGVLTQRSAGMGWGKIAKTMGVNLGSVVSASKTDKAGKKDNIAKIDDDSKKENVVKTVKAEKVEKVEKAEKTEKVEKVEKAEKAEKADNDKKDALAKVETAKTHSSNSDTGTSSAKGSSASSSSGGGSSNASSGNSGGGGGGGSSNGGGSKSSGGGGGGNSGGNGGGGDGNSGGNGGGGGKK